MVVYRELNVINTFHHSVINLSTLNTTHFKPSFSVIKDEPIIDICSKVCLLSNIMYIYIFGQMWMHVNNPRQSLKGNTDRFWNEICEVVQTLMCNCHAQKNFHSNLKLDNLTNASQQLLPDRGDWNIVQAISLPGGWWVVYKAVLIDSLALGRCEK